MNSGAIYGSWAAEEKEKGNLKEIYHFFLDPYCGFKLYDPCSTFLGLQITKLKQDCVGIL